MNFIVDKLKDFHIELIHWYYRNFQKRIKFRKFCIGVASIYLALQFLKYSRMALSLIPRVKSNLLKRYGEDSWALVTGGSDGIGKEFCIQLAKKGFNIVIVARNPQKMDDVCKQCHLYGVQTKFIVADFGQGSDSIFYERIKEQLDGLDVSMLINNVGMALVGQTEKIKSEQIIEQLRINALSTLMMTKIAFAKFQNRQHRSCVVSICSGTALVPPPYINNYICSKVYQSYFTHSLRHTYDQIDFIVAYPFGVTTKMLHNLSAKYTVQASDCVQGVLEDLRSGSHFTCGTRKHSFILRAIRNSWNFDDRRIFFGKSLVQLEQKFAIQQQQQQQQQK